MDRQALRFIDLLNDDSIDVDGVANVSIELKMKLFDKGQEWLTKRQKLRPDTAADTEGEGIRDMRSWINDPANREHLANAVFEAGFVKAPEKKNGRPTRAQAAVRARFKEHKDSENEESRAQDDSGWQGLLGEQA